MMKQAFGLKIKKLSFLMDFLFRSIYKLKYEAKLIKNSTKWIFSYYIML